MDDDLKKSALDMLTKAKQKASELKDKAASRYDKSNAKDEIEKVIDQSANYLDESGISDLVEQKANQTAQKISELGAVAIASGIELSKGISNSDWFRSINDYTSEVSKSMDKECLLSLKGEATEKMAPVYHRIVDGGHDLFSSIDIAKEIGIEKGWSDLETFKQWSASYFTDLSSPAGMPMFGKMSEDIYKFLKSIGISEENARDIVTINGQEAIESVLSGSITFLALFFSWKKEDQDEFSKTIGSILLASTVMMNPVSLSISLVMFAIGYQKLVNKEAMARGSIITGSSMLVSALIPGPVLVGAIPAIIVSIYVSKKMGSEFEPIKHSTEFVKFLTSGEFREHCAEVFGSPIAPAEGDISSS